MPRWLYHARVVPIGNPVAFPDQHGTPTTFLFDEFNFSRSAAHAPELPILIDHEPDMKIGRMASLWPSHGWWKCAFTLDQDLIRTPFDLRQNVSIGFTWSRDYPTVPEVGEVSIVRRGRVPGAEITHRYELDDPKPLPAARTTSPSAGEIIFHGGGRLIRPGIGQVTAVGGIAMRTKNGDPIRHVGDDIVIDRPDGTQVIYCGHEGRADFAREHGNGVRRRMTPR